MTDYRSNPDWRAFVKEIRQRPEDDLPRMVCADWLDEHGEHERAELIRLQCLALAALNRAVLDYCLEPVGVSR